MLNKFTDVGFPGHLTTSESEAYHSFCEEVNNRAGAFRNTVFCFGEVEDTAYAHCRWLRARKFNVKDTIQMVEEATECRSKAANNDFYPDPSEALGAEKSIYLAQYPQLYSGVSKHGCPVFITKPGEVSVNGLENITTLEGIINFHWWAMIHDFGARLRYQANKDPNFKRFETVAVIDLANLSASQISKRALNIVKIQSEIDSLCFPETLNQIIVINAPSFFEVTWKVISGWFDERTAAKVEVISSRKKWEKKLTELIDIDQLPSDYGGKAQSTKQIIQEDMKSHEGRDLSRLFSRTISVRSNVNFDLKLEKGETMDSISVFTRSLTVAYFSISHKSKNLEGISVVHEGKGLDTEKPTRITLPGTYCGPAKFTIKVDSKKALSSDSFLFIGKIKSSIELPVKSGTTNEELETELENTHLTDQSD